MEVKSDEDTERGRLENPGNRKQKPEAQEGGAHKHSEAFKLLRPER